MSHDYYQDLGINRNASDTDIQKAYRNLARKYHPDLNPDDKNAKQKFQEVQKAFDVLSDSNKRELYDRYGSSFESMGDGPQGGTTWQTTSGAQGFEDVDMSDFFGERFGGEWSGGGGFENVFHNFARANRQQQPGRRTGRSSRGVDVHHDLEVPLQTVISGGEARLTVHRAEGKTEQISVKIPAGIEDGKKIRLRQQGEKSPVGGMAGDILITIHVLPHPCFERCGKDLGVKVPVTLAEAALGASIDVPTPRGTISLKVPPGSSSGTKLRIREHGVTGPNDRAGDLYAELQVILPDTLDDEDARLIRELDDRHPMNPRRELKW